MTLYRIASLSLLAVAAFAPACTFSTGCASTAAGNGKQNDASAATTEYYYGTMSTSSPDGKVPYGPPVMTLVKRDVNPREETITETLLREGVTHVTSLERVEGGRFRASASDNTYNGTMEYSGDEWKWNNWRYAITMNDGSGSVEGTGRFDGKWIETEKFFVAPSGERRTRVIDRLVRITPEEYDNKRAEMLSAGSIPASKRR